MLLAIELALLAWTAVGRGQGDGKPIFNGRDLENWDGDKRFWSVAEGAIRGETSLASMPATNTFLIWRGSVLKDFELKLKVRLRNGNSGIQYRSRDLGKWSVAGYQMELDNGAGKSGFLYEERGRKFLALIGEKVEIDAQEKPTVLRLFAAKKDLVASKYYKPQDWNDYRIVAHGNHLEHFINGVQTVDVVDNDSKGRSLEGILAFQIHVGPPMLVEFKDIFLKSL
ncbi:MAG: DUF1080 domain-containing protein [Chthoniobacter sp.]|uniref:3-keto-disaccharide hydrolase n=1 Tax=Chthoniobacter sp. TaxID=2510640 RepID=UPI0032A1E362